MQACQARYGDVFTLSFPGVRRTVLMNPLDWPGYFKSRDLDFEAVGLEMAARAFGFTMKQIEQIDYDEARAQVTTFMRGDPLQAMTERMQTKLEERLFTATSGAWREDTLHRWANEHVFAAGADALFGDGAYDERLKQAYTVVDRRFGLLAMGVPAWLITGARRAQRELAECVAVKRPNAAQLLRERDALFEPHALDPAIRGHFDSGLMWAAQTNTISAAFWTILHVLRDPRARAAIHDEVRAIVGDEPPTAPGARLFSKAELKSMVKLESAIDEVNRLTTSPLVPRRALRDVMLTLHDGRRIQVFEGEDLMLFTPSAHYDPDIYESPNEFRFDRFLADEGGAKQWHKDGQRVHFFLMPFGGGKSMCPGRFFAINEFKITVATLLAWFDIELLSNDVPGFDLSRTGFGTYAPDRDVPFRLRLRRA
jgi:cytochrome P450